MNPATFLRVLGPEPWNVAYVEPSRRPADGRYGENPNRLQHYYQYQVILKPSPAEHPGDVSQEPARASASTPCGTTSASSRTTGRPRPWAPGGSAGKSGWTAWRSRSSPTSSRPAGSRCEPVAGEITYGIERIAMFLQGVDNVYDLKWNDTLTYGDVHHRGEVEWSVHNFEAADVDVAPPPLR